MQSTEQQEKPGSEGSTFSGSDWDLSGAISTRPETTRELYDWVEAYAKNNLGQRLVLPHTAICPGHTTPLSFLADGFFKRYTKQFVKANRSGGKTQAFGLMAFLESYFEGRGPIALEALDIGAVEDQADKCFSYSSSLWLQDEFRGELGPGGGVLKQSITLPNGTTIETGVATMKRTNGPHVPRLYIDEVELWSWEILQQAFSIPKSAGPHVEAVRMASTQKLALGPVQRFMDEMVGKGWRFYVWCIWEVLERCTQDRSCSRCEIYQWPDKQGGPLCNGRARHSTGYFKIDDFIDKINTLDRKTVMEEWLCIRPSREGLVYGEEYLEEVHRLPTRIPYSPELSLELTLDQGWTNPTAILFFQPDPGRDQLRLIGEEYGSERLPEEWGRVVADRLEGWGVSPGRAIECTYDPEDPAWAKTFALHCVSTRGTRFFLKMKRPRGEQVILDWIALCRRRLKIPIGGRARFIMGGDCKMTAWEFSQYRFPQKKGEDRPTSEKPVDKDNHAMSAWYRFEARKAQRPAMATTGKDFRTS